MRVPGDLLAKPPTRTVTEIQKHIVERGKRNAISRRHHAKDDRGAIAMWGLEFNRTLHIFHACFVISTLRSLTSTFQTQLGTNIRTTDSGTHQGVASKHTVVSDVHHRKTKFEVIVPGVRHDVPNTRPTVSGIHRDNLKGCENAGARNRAVGVTPVANVPVTG